MSSWPLSACRTGILCQIPRAQILLESAAKGRQERQGDGKHQIGFGVFLKEQETSIAVDREFPPPAGSQEDKSSLLRVKSSDALDLQGILSQQPCPWPQEEFNYLFQAGIEFNFSPVKGLPADFGVLLKWNFPSHT